MTKLEHRIDQDMKALANEWLASGYLKADDIFIVGCSTSEVAGEPIGTSGSTLLAQKIMENLEYLRYETGVRLAFQCCEHLNRAIVIDRATQEKYFLEGVSAVPVPEAGGSMASFAFNHMEDPVLVENIHAHSGIDIGDTMIGMHLKPVAVPLRFHQRYIGNARVTAAYSRGKLIGGSRAVYE